VRSWTPELGLFSSPLSTSASILMEVGAGLLGGYLNVATFNCSKQTQLITNL
jgi:hypothetical protein